MHQQGCSTALSGFGFRGSGRSLSPVKSEIGNQKSEIRNQKKPDHPEPRIPNPESRLYRGSDTRKVVPRLTSLEKSMDPL